MRAAILSVNYADYLAVTLPAWKAMLPTESLCVVTSPNDAETARLAAQHEVRCVVTDAWTRRDTSVHPWCPEKPDTFNCALALDVALGLAEDARPRPTIGEVVVSINADCYPQGQWPDTSHLDADTIYGIERFACETPKVFADVLAGRLKHTDLRRMKNSGGRPIGYFQLARYREGLRFGSFPTARKYDTYFCAKFAKKAFFNAVWLWHLGPMDTANWAGRTLPRWEAA